MDLPAPGIPAACYHKLKALGISHVVTVANAECSPLISRFEQDPECAVISACREGEAIAIAAGLALGGKGAAVSMECVGLFECCDTLRGLAVDMRIPMLLIIGYFGKRVSGWEQKFQMLGGNFSTIELASSWTEPFLKTMGIPYYTVDSMDEIGNLEEALSEARERSGPVAVLAERMVD